MTFALKALQQESYLHTPRIPVCNKLLTEVAAEGAGTASPMMDNCKATEEQENAAARVQATFKGYYTRKLNTAHSLGKVLG